MILESNPPDKKVHKGTSDTSCLLIASSNKNFTLSQVTEKLSVCGLDAKDQYLFTCNPDELKIAELAGFNS